MALPDQQQLALKKPPALGFKLPSQAPSAPEVLANEVDVSEESVESFILVNGIDEKAADALRRESPTIQRNVMADGPFHSGEDPSATVITRILNAKKEVPATHRLCRNFENGTCRFGDNCRFSHDPFAAFNTPDTVGSKPQQVERQNVLSKRKQQMCRNAVKGTCIYGSKCNFAHSIEELPEGVARLEWWILENKIEENVSKLLRNETPEVQQAVMTRGVLDDVQYPSSVVMGWVRDAQLMRGLAGPTKQEVEDFIRVNQLDDRCADMFRKCGPPVHLLVMQEGSLSSSANPSSSCAKRIQNAKLKIRDALKSNKGLDLSAPIPNSAFLPGGRSGQAATTVAAAAPTISPEVFPPAVIAAAALPAVAPIHTEIHVNQYLQMAQQLLQMHPQPLPHAAPTAVQHAGPLGSSGLTALAQASGTAPTDGQLQTLLAPAIQAGGAAPMDGQLQTLLATSVQAGGAAPTDGQLQTLLAPSVQAPQLVNYGTPEWMAAFQMGYQAAAASHQPAFPRFAPY